MQKNEIYGNGYHGIGVRDAGTNPVIENNTIHDNTESGIFIYGGAKGTVQKNEIYGNGYHGIEVTDAGTTSLIKGNIVALNAYYGVWIRNKAQAVVMDNIIIMNGWSGIVALGFEYGGNGTVKASHNDVWKNGCPQYRGLTIPSTDVSEDPGLEKLIAALAIRSPGAYQCLGWGYIRLGAYDGALGTFQQAHELGESDENFNRDLADCYPSLGEYEKASEYLQKVLDSNPKSDARLGLAWLRLYQGDYDTATRLVRDTIKTAGDDAYLSAWAHTTLGWIYLLTKDDLDATSEFAKALGLVPDPHQVTWPGGCTLHIWVNGGLGEAYQALGNPSKAHAAFEKAVTIGKEIVDCYEYDRDFLAVLGFSYLGLGNEKQGKAYLGKALKLSLKDMAEDTIAELIRKALKLPG